jgi:hypothetical protein
VRVCVCGGGGGGLTIDDSYAACVRTLQVQTWRDTHIHAGHGNNRTQPSTLRVQLNHETGALHKSNTTSSQTTTTDKTRLIDAMDANPPAGGAGCGLGRSGVALSDSTTGGRADGDVIGGCASSSRSSLSSGGCAEFSLTNSFDSFMAHSICFRKYSSSESTAGFFTLSAAFAFAAAAAAAAARRGLRDGGERLRDPSSPVDAASPALRDAPPPVREEERDLRGGDAGAAVGATTFVFAELVSTPLWGMLAAAAAAEAAAADTVVEAAAVAAAALLCVVRRRPAVAPPPRSLLGNATSVAAVPANAGDGCEGGPRGEWESSLGSTSSSVVRVVCIVKIDGQRVPSAIERNTAHSECHWHKEGGATRLSDCHWHKEGGATRLSDCHWHKEGGATRRELADGEFMSVRGNKVERALESVLLRSRAGQAQRKRVRREKWVNSYLSCDLSGSVVSVSRGQVRLRCRPLQGTRGLSVRDPSAPVSWPPPWVSAVSFPPPV